jgi:hypothetical protein
MDMGEPRLDLKGWVMLRTASGSTYVGKPVSEGSEGRADQTVVLDEALEVNVTPSNGKPSVQLAPIGMVPGAPFMKFLTARKIRVKWEVWINLEMLHRNDQRSVLALLDTADKIIDQIRAQDAGVIIASQ